MDLYQILGLRGGPVSTQSDIRTAYKGLAKVWHPDKCIQKTESAKLRFNDISEAYQILSDPEKKQHYDLVQAQRIICPTIPVDPVEEFWEEMKDCHEQILRESKSHPFMRVPNPKRRLFDKFSSTSTSFNTDGSWRKVKSIRYQDGSGRAKLRREVTNCNAEGVEETSIHEEFDEDDV